MGKPEMTNDQRDEMLANRPAPSVTKDLIESKIQNVEYVSKGVHTICYITLENGFIVTGQSACADPKNFNKELGEKIAYENAFREIWPLEGYVLRQALYEREAGKPGDEHEVSGDNKKPDPAPEKDREPAAEVVKPVMEAVQSANVEAIGYDRPNEQLFVDFKDGASYQYFHVPETVFDEFKKAPSKGNFLNAAIKNNYKWKKLTPKKAA